ncbi:type I restriction-modification system subunit M N-terminal domain-containing protein, partial [Candidatus Venteria ishoeyi]|uniref:type I restriction-modification system subunit M N-terminal domain-containing protein n=1 Tax=Candidatus Venteria ishoeyi TaxID=1899563 RepID=UPI000AE09406
MTIDQKKQLEQQLWNIADSLRGKMNADEFRDYCLGFIFYKYLSEHMLQYANNILSEDGIIYTGIDESSADGQEYLAEIKQEAIQEIGYFLKPGELFHAIAIRASKADTDAQEGFILDDLSRVLSNIESSTMGSESEEDFIHLFEDLDLTSTKLGRTEKAKNELIAKILSHLD